MRYYISQPSPLYDIMAVTDFVNLDNMNPNLLQLERNEHFFELFTPQYEI